MFPLKIDPSNVSHEYINTLPTLLHVIKKLIRRFLSRARPPFLKLLVDGSVKPIFRVILSYFVQERRREGIYGVLVITDHSSRTTRVLVIAGNGSRSVRHRDDTVQSVIYRGVVLSAEVFGFFLNTWNGFFSFTMMKW